MVPYQYLYGQEEKAIPYAQRWAELDPEDEDAPAVIQACQEEIAKRAEAEAEDESDHTGVFTGFVLLSKAEWDKEQFIRDMKEKWDIPVEEYDASEEKGDDALVFEVGDMLAAVSLASYPIPGGEAEGNAENNYMWEDAVKVAKEHRAHLMVAVLGKEEDLLEKGKLFTKVVAACCRQEYATGIYTSGVVFEPQFYEGFADTMQNDELPIFNWIWFGLWRDENGMNGYTYGLESFGKEEMEVLGTDAKPSDLRDFLASLVSYVLENDVELHDGETIGFAPDDKHTITRSPGVGLPEEQMTLKISWASSDGDPDGDGDDPDGEASEDEETGVPEVYTEEEMEAIEGHIQQYFGKFENVFHELSSPDIHVDICVVPPSKERYYQAMAKVIEERFTNWQGQDFDEDTLEPSEVAQAIMEYLDCECTYFPSMKDDDPIMAAYNYAKRDSAQEGFVPVLIKADDETLLECLVMNADPENDADIYEFDLKAVTEYRKKMLSATIKDGKAVLEELTGQRKEEAEDDDMDWDEEILGEMEGGYENNRFSCYWDSDTDMTHPLILAKIPVKNPWEIFAYLPFGNWNDCPDTPDLMAATKYWFEQYGAVPAAMSHDELEFLLPAPVHKEKAMDAAVELYGFCPDVIDQGPEEATVGALADVLRQSTVWYLWWD